MYTLTRLYCKIQPHSILRIFNTKNSKFNVNIYYISHNLGRLQSEKSPHHVPVVHMYAVGADAASLILHMSFHAPAPPRNLIYKRATNIKIYKFIIYIEFNLFLW